jgi:hypothetical protein
MSKNMTINLLYIKYKNYNIICILKKEAYSMYFGNVETNIGNTSEIFEILFAIIMIAVIITIVAFPVSSNIHLVIVSIILSLEVFGAIFVSIILNSAANSEDNIRTENSNNNIITAITEFYESATEIEIKNNFNGTNGEFESDGKTYKFFVKDNALYIKGINADTENVIDGNYYQ